MGAAFAFIALDSAIMIIGLIISAILSIIGLFVGKIHKFDSIALGLIGGICAKVFLDLHPAFCLLIGIGIFILILALLKYTVVGFWIISIVMSLLYAFIIGFIVYEIAKEDMIWGCVSFGLSFVLIFIFHLKSDD